MKTIYRYELPITAQLVSVDMPLGARVLPAPRCSRLRDRIEIWAEVDTSQPTERRSFCLVGTGSLLPPDHGTFVGTVMTHDGACVWHIYEC